MKLYSMPSSGNSYKIRLLMALLGIAYDHIACEVNSDALDQAKTEGKLPLGKLPALHLDDGNILTESGAILWFLAENTALLSDDPLKRAGILEWMFFEQNRMEPVIAVRASLNSYTHLAEQATPERMADLLTAGNALFGLLEAHLKEHDWLVGDAPSIADISVYGYTHSSGTRGGYDMSLFPAINAWCARMTKLDGYVALDHIP